jgi:hypothetical protein
MAGVPLEGRRLSGTLRLCSGREPSRRVGCSELGVDVPHCGDYSWPAPGTACLAGGGVAEVRPQVGVLHEFDDVCGELVDVLRREERPVRRC